MKGDPLVKSKKKSKKSHGAEKSGTKVGSLVCFRGSGRVLFFLFVLDALLRFETLVGWKTLRFGSDLT